MYVYNLYTHVYVHVCVQLIYSCICTCTCTTYILMYMYMYMYMYMHTLHYYSMIVLPSRDMVVLSGGTALSGQLSWSTSWSH